MSLINEAKTIQVKGGDNVKHIILQQGDRFVDSGRIGIVTDAFGDKDIVIDPDPTDTSITYPDITTWKLACIAVFKEADLTGRGTNVKVAGLRDLPEATPDVSLQFNAVSKNDPEYQPGLYRFLVPRALYTGDIPFDTNTAIPVALLYFTFAADSTFDVTGFTDSSPVRQRRAMLIFRNSGNQLEGVTPDTGVDPAFSGGISEARVDTLIGNHNEANDAHADIREEIPEQRVLVSDEAASADTLNKIVLSNEEAELTETVTVHEATPQSVTFNDLVNANLIGFLGIDPDPTPYTVGQWYFNTISHRPRVITDLDPIAAGVQKGFIGAVLTAVSYTHLTLPTNREV